MPFMVGNWAGTVYRVSDAERVVQACANLFYGLIEKDTQAAAKAEFTREFTRGFVKVALFESCYPEGKDTVIVVAGFYNMTIPAGGGLSYLWLCWAGLYAQLRLHQLFAACKVIFGCDMFGLEGVFLILFFLCVHTLSLLTCGVEWQYPDPELAALFACFMCCPM